MFVRQRGKRFQARVAIKGFPEQVKSFYSAAEAYAWGAQVERDIKAGGYAEPDRTTLKGALNRYLTEVTPGKKGAAKEASVIRKLLAHGISSLPLTKIRGPEVAVYRNALQAAGKAAATIGRHLAVLSNVFTTARKEWGIDVSNPVELVRKPKVRNARERRIRHSELVSLLSVTGSAELGWLVEMALETAMRRGELISLRWTQVDLDRRAITLIDTKNGLGRIVPLSRKAVDCLSAIPRRQDGKVFGLAPDSVTQAFDRSARRAGILNVRFHDLRHEAVSRLFEKGLHPIEVASISGHRDIRMLQRYTHLNAKHLLRKLDESAKPA